MSHLDFENKKTEILSLPQAVFVELTLNCNLHCPMCRPKGRYLPEQNMSFDIFKKIADELFPYAKVVDLRGSGESTILPDFVKYIEYANSFNTQLKLVTNLSIQNDELWELLIRNHFILGISFDAATPLNFERIRAGAKFQIVMDNLKKLVSYSQKHDVPIENIYLTTVVQGGNISEIPDILKIAHKIGINRIKLFPLKCSEHNPNNLIHYQNSVRSMFDAISVISDDLGLMVEIGASLSQSLAFSNSIPNPCIHPWMYCYVDYQGGIGFCDHLNGKPEYTLGNIKTETFKNIWNNSSFQELRKEHVEQLFGPMFLPCEWCYANRYIDLEYLYYPPYKKLIVSKFGRGSKLQENW